MYDVGTIQRIDPWKDTGGCVLMHVYDICKVFGNLENNSYTYLMSTHLITIFMLLSMSCMC